MKCTAMLIQDHKIILRAVNVVADMAARMENGKPVEAGDVEAILGFLRAFADNHHQTKEDSALFPVLMTAAADHGAIRHVSFEHDRERSLVEGLEDALRTRRGKEFIHFAQRLVQMIRSHIDKEESVLFPMADQSLSPAQDERICTQFGRFEIDASYVADLRRLESRYSGGVAA